MNIHALIMEDIKRRAWGAMHVRADNRLPFMLGDGRVRSRGGEMIVVRSEVPV